MYRVTDLTPLARGGGAGVPANTGQQRPLTERGTVVVAPTSEADKMVVVTSSSSTDYGIEIPAGNWTPRGTALPALGAECLVVFDDVGDAFVPTWSGATTFPVVTAADWIAPTLTNSWVNLGSPWALAGYLKDPMGFVHLRGEVNGGVNGSIIFTLPTGYRPVAALNLPVVNGSGAFAYIQVAASGTVEAVNVSGALSLNVAPFLAEN